MKNYMLSLQQQTAMRYDQEVFYILKIRICDLCEEISLLITDEIFMNL